MTDALLTIDPTTGPTTDKKKVPVFARPSTQADAIMATMHEPTEAVWWCYLGEQDGETGQRIGHRWVKRGEVLVCSVCGKERLAG